MDARSTPEGETLYVAREEASRGSEGPFFTVYRTEDGTRRWGYQCGNCGSFETAMDTMGRIVCNDCPNIRKPTEWDAAHE
ncbi:GNAT family acetyltransferase [Halobacteriales archaeon QS_1_68_20]|nr:MAG: GNAT family acetyltransferase [Halobacteriales archaeon QS_1_68_20]